MPKLLTKAQARRLCANDQITPSQPYPGLSREMEKVVRQVMAGRIPAGSGIFKIKPWVLWSRKAYAAAGQTNLRFYNDPYDDFVTNLPTEGQLNNEMCLVAKSMHLAVETGIAADGTKDAAGNQVYSHATATAPILLAEECRQALIAGQLKLKVGDTDLVDQKDLTHFAHGGGFNFSSGAAMTFNSATTLNGIALPFSNQSPTGKDLWNFQPWQAILPSKKIDCRINWKSVIAITSAVTFLRVGIAGLLITPSNS